MTKQEGFEQFWTVYPRHREKFRARAAYDKALKRGTHKEIMTGATRYAMERMGKEQQYTKHPATWLNAGCWLDYEGIAASVAAIALNMPRAFKCPECFQVTIGMECGHCRRKTA